MTGCRTPPERERERRVRKRERERERVNSDLDDLHWVVPRGTVPLSHVLPHHPMENEGKPLPGEPLPITHQRGECGVGTSL